MTKTTTPEAGDQRLTTLPPLRPLEYCRPERAAKLLNCEVEDLYHWAAIGAIRMYIRAEKAVQPELTTLISVVCDELDDNLTYVRKLKYGASFTAYQIANEGRNFGWSNAIAQVSGFWALGGWHFVEWEDNGVISGESDDCDCFDLYALPDEDAPPVWALRLNIPNIKDNLWLMREDLEKLQRHIISGERFDVDEVEQVTKPISSSTKPRKITNPHITALYLLSELACKSDDEFREQDDQSINRKYEIISTRLANAGLAAFPVERRQFRTWFEHGRDDLAEL